jgi:hypothetical protein
LNAYKYSSCKGFNALRSLQPRANRSLPHRLRKFACSRLLAIAEAKQLTPETAPKFVLAATEGGRF